MCRTRKLFFPLMAALLSLIVIAPLISMPTVTAPINALLAGEPGSLIVGDTWTYNVIINATYNTTAIHRVVGITNIIDWNGTSTQCYQIKIESVPIPLPYNETWICNYLRVSDQKQIAQDIYMLMNASGVYSEMYAFYYTNDSLDNGYPLSVGKTWNQTIILNVTAYSHVWPGTDPWINTTITRDNATQELEWQAYEVLNSSNVTVPAGTFETWCINATVGNQTMIFDIRYNYFSPQVKNNVLVTNSTGGTMLELISYSFGLDPTMVLLLFLTQQQQQSAMMRTYIYIGAGLGIVALVVLGIGLWMRRS